MDAIFNLMSSFDSRSVSRGQGQLIERGPSEGSIGGKN